MRRVVQTLFFKSLIYVRISNVSEIRWKSSLRNLLRLFGEHHTQGGRYPFKVWKVWLRCYKR